MNDIPIGSRGSFEMVVSQEHLADRFKDSMLPSVLATPVMIMAMENAALNAVKPFLAKGYNSVGTRVDVEHLAATPVGSRVRAEAEVTGFSGRRIEFTVRAFDDVQKIGEGRHQRSVIDMAKFNERLKSRGGAG